LSVIAAVLVRKSLIKLTLVCKSVENVVTESGKTSNGHRCCQTVYFLRQHCRQVEIGLATATRQNCDLRNDCRLHCISIILAWRTASSTDGRNANPNPRVLWRWRRSVTT